MLKKHETHKMEIIGKTSKDGEDITNQIGLETNTSDTIRLGLEEVKYNFCYNDSL
jgi:hypothetical protein